MTRVQARNTAREILEIIPLVMRTVAAELRAAGEMPAPAHFGLLSILSVRPRMLSDLASIQASASRPCPTPSARWSSADGFGAKPRTATAAW